MRSSHQIIHGSRSQVMPPRIRDYLLMRWVIGKCGRHLCGKRNLCCVSVSISSACVQLTRTPTTLRWPARRVTNMRLQLFGILLGLTLCVTYGRGAEESANQDPVYRL